MINPHLNSIQETRSTSTPEHRKRVLHVVESFGGGVRSAVLDYVAQTPELEHDLLYTTRNDSPISDEDLKVFCSVTKFRRGFLARLADVRRLTSSTDVVHAHSSFAGLYTRIGLLGKKPRPRIIYTPHCFAFERCDIPVLLRWMLWVAEFWLARNTDVIAGCSPREVLSAQKFHSRRTKVLLLPNAVQTETLNLPSIKHDRHGVRIVAIGRNAPQKDPEFFFQLYNEFRKLRGDSPFEWQWIGGDKALQDRAPKGIYITGWLGREETIKLLSEGDVYIHTASWEGFPITLLEAVNLGLAPIVRKITAFNGIALPYVAETPQEMARMLNELEDGKRRLDAVCDATAALRPFSPSNQRTALNLLYGDPR